MPPLNYLNWTVFFFWLLLSVRIIEGRLIGVRLIVEILYCWSRNIISAKNQDLETLIRSFKRQVVDVLERSMSVAMLLLKNRSNIATDMKIILHLSLFDINKCRRWFNLLGEVFFCLAYFSSIFSGERWLTLLWEALNFGFDSCILGENYISVWLFALAIPQCVLKLLEDWQPGIYPLSFRLYAQREKVDLESRLKG